MATFLKNFDGFTKEDFETYTQEKWTSNLFNLQRMQVKQKLTALGGLIRGPIEAMDLEQETSTERPSIWNQKKVKSQWLYMIRNAKAQRELQSTLDRERTIAQNVDDPAHHHRHIVLAVRVDARGAAVMCALHHNAWLDLRNLREKWAISHERAKLLDLLQNHLEDGMNLVVNGESTPVAAVEEEQLSGILKDGGYEGWLSIEALYPPDDPNVQTEQFCEEVYRVFGILEPLYNYIAWAKDNDFLSLAKKVVQEKKEKRRHGAAPFQEGDQVEIVGGLFAGRNGVVQGFDRAGKVKVRVGTLALPVNAGSLKLLAKP